MAKLSEMDWPILEKVSRDWPKPIRIGPKDGRANEATLGVKKAFLAVVDRTFQERLAFAEKIREWGAECPGTLRRVDPYWWAWAARLPSAEDARTRAIYKERVQEALDAWAAIYGPLAPVTTPYLFATKRLAASSLGLSVEEVSWLFPLPQIAVDPTKKEGEKNFSPSQNFSLAKGGEPG